MIPIGLLIIFAIFAVLMFTRKVSALLALPAMAILIAILAQLSPVEILNNIIAQGTVKLAAVYVAVFAGAMMGRVMIQTGIAEEIIKRAAEFGGEKPLIVAFGLMIVTAVLFTTLQGLGAIITVGSLVFAGFRDRIYFQPDFIHTLPAIVRLETRRAFADSSSNIRFYFARFNGVDGRDLRDYRSKTLR
jgi:H+/gluconate symporter-like permease